MQRSQAFRDRENELRRARRRGIALPSIVSAAAKQAIIAELERGPQTKRAITEATGLPFKTVEGTISRLVELGAAHSDSFVIEFRPGPKRKIYKAGPPTGATP